jgi:hypothetical protein
LRAVRVFGVVVAVVQLASMIAFGASMYTILVVASSTASGDATAISVKIDEATGVGVLRFDAATRNEGLLGVNVKIGVYAFDVKGERFADNSTSVHLEVGQEEPVSLTLRLPAGLIRRMLNGDGDCFEVTVELRTLNDLVGASNTITYRGGGSA